MCRMEIVVLLLFLGLGALCLLGVGALMFNAHVNRREAEAIEGADSALDAEFDGRQVVTVHYGMGTLPLATLVAGASERGYALTTTTSNKYGFGDAVFTRQ